MVRCMSSKISKKYRRNIKIHLKHYDRKKIKLEFGDIVERHLMDNDYALFNRQPSLQMI